MFNTRSGTIRNRKLAIAVLALWFISAATLISRQGSGLIELFALKNLHPEIPPPGQDPDSALSVIGKCVAEVTPGDTLGVLFHDEDAVQVFLAYRLAYVLYPRTVAPLAYRECEADKAIEHLRNICNPTLWLVFTEKRFIPPPGSRVVAHLPLNALLFRSSTTGNQ